MKKLFILFLFILFWINNVGAYTNEKWEIIKEQKIDYDLDSTTFYPKWFLDWSFINYWNEKRWDQPMWLWRTHWIEAIDWDKNINCNEDNHLYHKKCFMRHAWDNINKNFKN